MDRPYQPTLHFLHAASPGDATAYLSGVDPRARLVAAVALALVVAAAHGWIVPAIALAAAVLGVALSGLSPKVVLRRLLLLESVMLLLLLLLPLGIDWGAVWKVSPLPPGEGPGVRAEGTEGTDDCGSLTNSPHPNPLPAGEGTGGGGFRFGFLLFSHDGLWLALQIALKANAIVLGLMALVGTMDAMTLGHALCHLHVPDKLAHLLLFTVRYLDIFHREYGRLRAAMKVRGFRPHMNLHTYRVYGYLVGMLLVRSFDRSERIVAAMKCRCFRGRFYVLSHFHFSSRDVPFCAAFLMLLATLALVNWL
jgi:cobalt/nickel transport system permease protein